MSRKTFLRLERIGLFEVNKTMEEESYTFIAKVVVTRGPKWKSYRITIPKAYGELLGLDEGDMVMVSIKKINIKTPTRKKREKKT